MEEIEWSQPERPMIRCECMDHGPSYSNAGNPHHDGSPDECPDCYQGERPSSEGDPIRVPCLRGCSWLGGTMTAVNNGVTTMTTCIDCDGTGFVSAVLSADPTQSMCPLDTDDDGGCGFRYCETEHRSWHCEGTIQ